MVAATPQSTSVTLMITYNGISGLPSGYMLRITLTSQNLVQQYVVAQIRSLSVVSISGLIPDTIYEVVVIAMNNGENATPVTSTTRTIPSGKYTYMYGIDLFLNIKCVCMWCMYMPIGFLSNDKDVSHCSINDTCPDEVFIYIILNLHEDLQVLKLGKPGYI